MWSTRAVFDVKLGQFMKLNQEKSQMVGKEGNLKRDALEPKSVLQMFATYIQ